LHLIFYFKVTNYLRIDNIHVDTVYIFIKIITMLLFRIFGSCERTVQNAISASAQRLYKLEQNYIFRVKKKKEREGAKKETIIWWNF